MRLDERLKARATAREVAREYAHDPSDSNLSERKVRVDLLDSAMLRKLGPKSKVFDQLTQVRLKYGCRQGRRSCLPANPERSFPGESI